MKKKRNSRSSNNNNNNNINNNNAIEPINSSNKRIKSEYSDETKSTNNDGNNNSSTSSKYSITTNNNTDIEKCSSSNDVTIVDSTTSSNNTTNIDAILDKLFNEYTTGSTSTDNNTDNTCTTFTTITKSSWCLRTGLKHIVSVDIDWNDRKLKIKQKQTSSIHQQQQQQQQQPIRMIDLIQQHGLPNYCSCFSSSNSSMKCKNRQDTTTQDDGKINNPNTCFESLCRIIIGQMVSSKVAQVIWYRFVTYIIDQSTSYPSNDNTFKKRTIDDDESSKVILFTPEQVLSIVQQSSNTDTSGTYSNYDEQSIIELLQKPVVGLTKNKAKSIIDLAYHFVSKQLSEDLFLQRNNASNNEMIKTKLLKVKGIGQWTYEIFVMFFLEQSNILPLGDLGIRKGISIYCPRYNFFSTTNKSNVNDEMTKVRTLLQCYEPYHSLFTYYMWKLVDDTKSNTTKPTTTTTSITKRDNT